MNHIASNIKYISFFTFVVLSIFTINSFADDVVWQSGKNQYITITKIEKYKDGEFPQNEHPVDISAEVISHALHLLEIWDKNYYKDGEVQRVFTVSQERILGKNISLALKKASPKQDILFGLAATRKGVLFSNEVTFTAGRVFYADNMLHIILGDYMKPKDKGKEAMAGSFGETDIKYTFIHGKRKNSLSLFTKFEENLIKVDGISNYAQKGKRRKDWIVFDLVRTEKTYLAEIEAKNRKKNKNKAVTNEAFEKEAAKLAKERREMRLEMARLRKEMEQTSQNNGPLSAEERLKNLEDLKNKDLITEEEYNLKRKEILDNI